MNFHYFSRVANGCFARVCRRRRTRTRSGHRRCRFVNNALDETDRLHEYSRACTGGKSRESDPEILRNAVRLLVNENDVLLRKLQAALSKNAALTGKDQATALAQMELLKEQLAAANRKLYGASSEQRSASDEPVAPDAAAPVAKQKGHGPTPQSALPRIEVLHNIASDDASCSACGSALAIWEGHDETSDEITVVERTFASAGNVVSSSINFRRTWDQQCA